MRKMNKPARCRLLQIGVLVMGCGMISTSGAYSKAAVQPHSEIEATFTGELFDIPCKFQNTTDLDFDFQNVINAEIDDKSHHVDVFVNITCEKESPKKLVTVRLLGTQLAGAANNVLDGGIPNLGIELTSADSGKAFNFDTPITEGTSGSVMKLHLRATLMNNVPATPVQTGFFSTELTLSANYE